MANKETEDVAAVLKQLYSEYMQTEDIDARSRFFSPHCRQICRPTPSFAAKERSTIVRYLHETSGRDADATQALMEEEDTPGAGRNDQPGSRVAAEATRGAGRDPRVEKKKKKKKKSCYTIRALREDEVEFGADDAVRPAGFSSAAEAEGVAASQGWVGMRVDLWDDEGADEAGRGKGAMVKVRYWWRREGDEWLHILHDIMYIGQRDATEGSEGEIIERK